jgi:hypothetical protein
MTKCRDCSGTVIQDNNYENVCTNCGLIQQNNSCNFVHENPSVNCIELRRNNNNKTASKLKKMQNWYMWTNEEKNQYKLALYTRELCHKVGVSEKKEYFENILQTTCDTVKEVMKVIKEQDGTKRARVKDGIILVCLQYVLRNANMFVGENNTSSAVELGKKINLQIKYISKAENMILEYINNGKLKLQKNTILKTKKAYDYVEEVMKKHNFKVSPNLMLQVKRLIDICETNDILLDHTPLSTGVCCFYYILKNNNIKIDAKVFSDLYNLSSVTVMKTFNKLKQHSVELNLKLS